MRKRKGRGRISGLRTWVTPTKERRRQNGGVICEIVPSDPTNRSYIRRYRAVWECPLDAYYGLNVIDKASYRAGLLFHRAYYGAVICRPVDLRLTGYHGASMEKTKHERLLDDAYVILPPDTVNAVVDICGHSKPAFSPRALEKLRKGLGHLAVGWHMAAIEVCDHRKRK